jgi:hypothetical protein
VSTQKIDPVVADAQQQLLPMLAELDRILAIGDDTAARDFFQRIATSLGLARTTDDLMPPFMQLATSAFQGFDYEFSASILLDEILAASMTLSWTLSADESTSQ